MMQPSRPPATPVIPKPRVIGPCYRCAGWGHLAASCTKAKASYPLNQPVVGLADPLANIDACVLNVDSSTVACSAEESGKSKGVGSNLDKGTDVNNKVVEGVTHVKHMAATQKVLILNVLYIQGMLTLRMPGIAWRHQNIGSWTQLMHIR